MGRLVRHRGGLVKYLLLLAVAFVGLLFYYWMFLAPKNKQQHVHAAPVIPNPVNWSVWRRLARPGLHAVFPEPGIAVAITAGNLLLASLAGYSLCSSPSAGALFL
jgi:ABC-type glycerol-3-phosphate transport system permease component